MNDFKITEETREMISDFVEKNYVAGAEQSFDYSFECGCGNGCTGDCDGSCRGGCTACVTGSYITKE